MLNKKVIISFKEYPERFNRTILVNEDINLVYLGCVICSALNSAFEHLFLFEKDGINYVSDAFLDEYIKDNWLAMKEYTLNDLKDNFIFEYDTGAGWLFDCVVEDYEYDGDEYYLLLDGKGQGIWEDNKSSLIHYLDGNLDSESSFEDEEGVISLPWNFDNTKYGDFDLYDISKDISSFNKKVIEDINKYITGAHEYGYELEVDELNINILGYNPQLQKHILEVVNNQINELDYVNKKYMKLKDKYGEIEAKRLIGVVIIEEIFNALKFNKTFNDEEYRKRINRIK